MSINISNAKDSRIATKITEPYLPTLESPSNNNGLSMEYSHISGLSTYDSIKLTTPLLSDNEVVNMKDWSVNSSKRGLSKRQMLLFSNSDGSITQDKQDNTVTTLGITQNYLYGVTIVDIPSASTYLHGHPLRMLLDNEVGAFQEKLQTDLSQHVKFDIDKMDVGRLDSSALYQMDNKVSEYVNMFKHSIPGKVKRRSKTVHKDQTIEFGVKASRVKMYDKIAQLRAKGYGEAPFGIATNNLLRFESSLLKKPGIVNRFGHLKFHHLSEDRIIANAVEQRTEQFYNYFKLDNEAMQRYSTRLEISKSIVGAKVSHREQKLISTIALSCDFISIDYVLDLLSDGGQDRYQQLASRKKLNKLIYNNPEITNLYQEVKSKIDNDLAMVA